MSNSKFAELFGQPGSEPTNKIYSLKLSHSHYKHYDWLCQIFQSIRILKAKKETRNAEKYLYLIGSLSLKLPKEHNG